MQKKDGNGRRFQFAQRIKSMNQSSQDIQKLFELAKQTAREAGDFLQSQKVKNIQILSQVGKDIKLKDDIESEKIIIVRLSSASPWPILSEEKGWTAEDNLEFRWLIDPLDGTMNFSRGLPTCCVSIGLWKKNEPIFGVIYDFNRNELFSGVVGDGAWLNDSKIKVSHTNAVNQAILSTGFPSKTSFTKESLDQFVSEVQAYKKIRMIGSSALSLAYVASGRVDAYYENDIMLWDIAGGIPIVLAAGGSASFEETKQNACSYRVFVSNGIIQHPSHKFQNVSS